MRLYDRILGNPFVYDRIRPLVVGGIDMSAFYDAAGIGAADVVLDLGCGTGDALRYLRAFDRYVGIDTDERAVRVARARWRGTPTARFECRRCTPQDVDDLAPTHVILSGVLHHLDDAEAVSLLALVRRSPRLERVATVDIAYLPGKPVNNLLSRLDRGRHCRQAPGYAALAERSGLRIVETRLVRSHPTRGIATYFSMTLVP